MSKPRQLRSRKQTYSAQLQHLHHHNTAPSRLFAVASPHHVLAGCDSSQRAWPFFAQPQAAAASRFGQREASASEKAQQASRSVPRSIQRIADKWKWHVWLEWSRHQWRRETSVILATRDSGAREETIKYYSEKQQGRRQRASGKAHFELHSGPRLTISYRLKPLIMPSNNFLAYPSLYALTHLVRDPGR